jgi:hypothetical protein
MGIVLDPTKCFPVHPGEEFLEEYVLQRLPEDLTAQVEEHLLICPRCQDAVTETDQFVSAMRAAVQEQVPAVGPARLSWRSFLDALPAFSTGGISLTAVCLLAILAFLSTGRRAEEIVKPAAVSLTSLRGPHSLSSAPAGKPLDFHIESPDLAPGRRYEVEVVNAAGAPVWKGSVADTGGKLVAHMPRPLRAGAYWVRLYGADSELLREFGLSTK